MKKIAVLIPALLFALFIMAQPPEGPAKAGMTFGEKIVAKGAIHADSVMNVFNNDKKTADIKVKGVVVDVCKAEGCWLRMETANGPMLVKMKDHSYFVPLAMNGKTIVAEGTATYKETPVATLKHYAEDAGKSKDEIAAIKEPKKEVVLEAKGIIVM
ncbi:MAG: DUF4920 domain-containing protein [Ferruginibacter sp.]